MTHLVAEPVAIGSPFRLLSEPDDSRQLAFLVVTKLFGFTVFIGSTTNSVGLPYGYSVVPSGVHSRVNLAGGVTGR
jgi:hypothetical protein